MRIDNPTPEDKEFYSTFKTYKLVHKGGYNEYISIYTSDIRSALEFDIIGRKYLSYLDRAVEKNCAFELSFSQFKAILSQNCVYCGELGETIDRIDSKGCYTLDNIQACCKACNFMKYTSSEESFLSQVKKIQLYKNL